MPANRFDRTAYTTSAEDASQDEFDTGGPEALKRLQRQLEELGDYARLYAEAKKDALLATTRRIALWAVAGLTAFAVLGTLVTTAAVLGLLGLAQAVGVLLGERMWAGYMVVGGGLLLLVALGFLLGIKMVQRQFRKQTVNKYAQRHQTQRHGNAPRRRHSDPAGSTPTASEAERN